METIIMLLYVKRCTAYFFIVFFFFLWSVMILCVCACVCVWYDAWCVEWTQLKSTHQEVNMRESVTIRALISKEKCSLKLWRSAALCKSLRQMWKTLWSFHTRSVYALFLSTKNCNEQKSKSDHFLMWPPFAFKPASVLQGTLAHSF